MEFWTDLFYFLTHENVINLPSFQPKVRTNQIWKESNKYNLTLLSHLDGFASMKQRSCNHKHFQPKPQCLTGLTLFSILFENIL